MIYDLKNGYFLATGTVVRDAVLKYIGERKTPITEFGIAAGKRKDSTTIFIDLKCWRELAMYASLACKGDAVAAIGTIEEREYNGKVYKKLVCEWLNIPVGEATASAAPMPGVVSTTTYSDLDDADGELPF